MQRRMLRLMSDALAMRRKITSAEARVLYSEIEQARDALSYILDRADGKNA